MTERAYYTLRATAERLGCSRTSIDRLARQGYLVKVPLPGFSRRVVVTAESIAAYEELVAQQARRLQLVEGAIA